VTDSSFSDLGAADPTTELFWQACARRRLVIQHCTDCGAWQHYPRPFCLSCDSTRTEWADAAGRGTVYSVATMRIPVTEDLTPPYQIALVDLDEGPRLLTTISGRDARIGDRVTVGWRDRAEGLPPVPVFSVAP
jgi:uncharacterized OB-fold protein